MNLWGKSQDELDAERQQSLNRREEIARRDAQGRSPEQLAKFYTGHLPPSAPVTTYHFGDDVEGFDSIGSECQSLDEFARAMRGEDDAGYGGRWVAGIVLALLAVLMITVAAVMLLR